MRRSAAVILGIAGVIAVRVPCMLFLTRGVLAVAGAGPSEQSRALVAMACDGGMMVVLAWLAAGLLRLDRSRAFPLAWPRGAVLAGAGIGVLVAGVNALIVHRFFPQAAASSTTVATYLQGAPGPGAHLALGFGLAVFSPVVEEIYFRGLLQQGLDEAVPYAGMLAATLLFVTEHPGSLSSPAIWILGLALALIYRRTRSVSATIACHVVNNCLILYVLPLLTR
ncbi:MAG: CPBP family intramembrane metalloprotease [Elusimicrobia bacterium]|nr:CPBP family intramembrane metalloprotease [Elusimicrobiota bacterium]